MPMTLAAIMLIHWSSQLPTTLEFKTARTHPMGYYIALPKGWTKGKKWPVLVAIESADRQFKENAEEFVKARGNLPFIIVAPLVLTNGGSQVAQIPTYPYAQAVWDRVEREGHWTFDSDGLRAVLADVQKEYSAESQVYLTGWEAGCHTVWALLFNHPEWIRAAAPVCPNYQGRWIVKVTPRDVPRPPIRILGGDKDPYWAPGKPFYDQTQNALREATARGFDKVSIERVPGEGHGALATAVMKYLASLLPARQPG